MSKSRKKHHYVYVVELDRAVWNERRFRDANPGYDHEKPCLYVGLTGLDPEKRFENHLAGYKSNRYVHRYGRRLYPRLYEEYNPLSYEDGREMEVELARMLREKGYAVWQK
ncbi:MAG: hypothetical protein JXB45_00470 [Candidatus Krumholzibacteriota bacterium]|nr:hypothetical protein [Candidatus Krumholzibacteriota bacterium]